MADLRSSLTIRAAAGSVPPLTLHVMTATDGSRTGPFLSAETMAEYIADPGIPNWNTDPNYGMGWESLSAQTRRRGTTAVRYRGPSRNWSAIRTDTRGLL